MILALIPSFNSSSFNSLIELRAASISIFTGTLIPSPTRHLPFGSPSAKDAISEYDELKIYDDAFKNYLWVKVFDDNVFAIIKSHCISHLSVL